MKRTGIFYGSTTGNTQSAAEAIASKMGVDSADVFDIGKTPVSQMENYDVILLGSSTWGLGDLQDDWEAVIEELEGLDLAGKKVGVFGTGDSLSYPDSFCDAVGTLAGAAQRASATLIGRVDEEGYSFDESKAQEGSCLTGLLLDEDNEPEKSGNRIDKWIERLMNDGEIE